MSEKSNMPPPGDKLATYEVGSPQENLGANAEGGNTRAQTSLERSLKSLGHEPDNAPAPSDSAVKPMETGTEISTEPAKTPGESAEKPRTEFEQQQEEAQEKLQNILDERQKLAEMGKQLDTKESEIKIQLETQEREGVERSKEARNALDEISHLIPDGAPNPHRDALKKTLENLPDKMTAKDVANFTEGARWDAAKASVGDKDFANMSQTEKDVVLERVKKMGENNTSNPESGHWETAKTATGLSPGTKWADMSLGEQRLVQERVTEAKNEVSSVQKPEEKTSDSPVGQSTIPVAPAEKMPDVSDTSFSPPKDPTVTLGNPAAATKGEPVATNKLTDKIFADTLPKDKFTASGDYMVLNGAKVWGNREVGIKGNSIKFGVAQGGSFENIDGGYINLDENGNIENAYDYSEGKDMDEDMLKKIIEELRQQGIVINI